ncbi:transmembrane protein 62-like isoform X2 [Onthophagus taurus]|uniref:transmembrane protein 62-like isoform X2 n=1 Tax=Onthophagus taurus TaxID=166361 RepID=UPI0039BE0E98
MRISKTAFLALVSMILFSVFIANVTNLLNNDVIYVKQERIIDKEKFIPMTDTASNLIWFLQITDIHISVFRDPFRITELKEFCDQTIDIIKPVVVLASGDLTDAKTKDNIGSKQIKQEWEYYKNVLKECNIEHKTVWLDIRGNHDNFNVVNFESKENFFPNFSIQGRKHSRSYMYQIKRHDQIYSFIGVDACLEPGPKRPFNFVGMLENDEVTLIHKLIKRVKSTGSNHTVWFGHFPTSCIVTDGDQTIRDIIGELDQSIVYVCGHLHTLGGLVPNMYTLQREGYLELELGDWKDNRRFRLMAIDHGTFSFVDVNHRDWPIILVTNPKHEQFMLVGRDEAGVILNSSHIRVLVFSLGKIETVKIRIDSEHWRECRNVDRGPLYVIEWSPEMYTFGMHTLEVFAKDEDGRYKMEKSRFSLDGKRTAFSFLARVALMTDASTVFKAMFGSAMVASIIPLIICRILHRLVKKKINKPSLRQGFFKTWFRRLWILSSIDRIFYPLVLYPIYLCIGPWSVGYIIEDHIGFIFPWGIYINNKFLPGSFTYFYGFLQFVTFQIPITFILASGVNHRYKNIVLNISKPTSCKKILALHLPFLILISIQIFMAYFFWLAYGTMAFILGPLRTWSIILALILWHQALRYPEKCAAGAAAIWDNKPTDEANVSVFRLNPM